MSVIGSRSFSNFYFRGDVFWSGQVALEAEEEQDFSAAEVGNDCDMDGFMGATDDSWEDWEEWMGWEGAGITDYSSHVNSSYSF